MVTEEKYFTFKELESFLHNCQKKHPDLFFLETLGRTPEGREFYFVTLTKNIQTHAEKPALWLDGNIHATELSGTQTCLYVIEHLLTHAKSDHIDYLLTHFTLYIFPRVSVDGADYVLDSKKILRSSLQPFSKQNPHLQFDSKDLNDDGMVLQMRIEDPTGLFKKSKKDPRLLVAREITDALPEDGPFYHILPEGDFPHLSPEEAKKSFTQRQDTLRFDLNRQSPAFFSPQEKSAGPLPLYLPEAKALANAFVQRKNICCAISFHTFGGVLLHPPSTYPFHELPSLDQRIYNQLSEKATALTDYPTVNSFADFRYDINTVSRGLWCDWYYEHRGAFAWTPELWSLLKELGIEVKNPVQNFENLTEERYLKALNWCDQHLDKKDYYKDWEIFNHPQLGKVEIGGWIPLKVWSNPPEKFLHLLLKKIYPFVELHLKVLPLIKISEVTLNTLSDQHHLLKFKVHNEGYLPTYISEKAKSLSLHAEPELRVSVDTSQKTEKVIYSKQCAHLSGRANYEPAFSPLFSHLKSAVVSSQSEYFEILLNSKDLQTGKLIIQLDYQMAGIVSHQVNK